MCDILSNTPVTCVIRSQLCFCNLKNVASLMLCSLFVPHRLPSWQTAAVVGKKENHWPTSPILDVISSFKTVVTTTSLFSLLRRFALTTKIPDTKGCHKCCIGEWPLPPNHFVIFTHPSIILNCVDTSGTSLFWACPLYFAAVLFFFKPSWSLI